MNVDTKRPYNIRYLCGYTQTPRSSYYKWLKHEPSKRQIENQAIVAYMIELEEKDHYTHGVEELTTYINKYTEYHVGHNKVRRLMAEHGIKAAIRVKKHDRHDAHKNQILANLFYDKKAIAFIQTRLTRSG